MRLECWRRYKSKSSEISKTNDIKLDASGQLDKYEGCSNMNASSFITFFTHILRQNIIPFWKELFVAFKMSPNIKKH